MVPVGRQRGRPRTESKAGSTKDGGEAGSNKDGGEDGSEAVGDPCSRHKRFRDDMTTTTLVARPAPDTWPRAATTSRVPRR